MQPDPAVFEAAVLFPLSDFFWQKDELTMEQNAKAPVAFVQSEKGVSANRQHDSHSIIVSCFFGQSQPYIKFVWNSWSIDHSRLFGLFGVVEGGLHG